MNQFLTYLLVLSALSYACAGPMHHQSGYGQAQPLEIIETPRPIIQEEQRVEIVKPFVAPVVSSYNTEPLVRDEPAKIIAAPVVAPSYNTEQPLFRDEPAKIIASPIVEPDMDLVRWCQEKKTGTESIFYLPHPTRRSFYIQCDEHGGAFLKECPQGTIFTLNLVCEDVNNLHPIETKPAEVPAQMIAQDQHTGSYGQVPTFQQEPSALVSTRVEIRTEAPEFRSLCETRRREGGVGVFYLQHPTDRHLYIQCDEHGEAYLRQCLQGLVFTHNLVCENPDNIIEATQTPVAAQLVQADTTPIVQSGYGTAAVVEQPAKLLAADNVVEVLIRDAPEFKEMCATVRQGNQGVFYLPHPNKQSLYIQCDEFGRAFLKECPVNTIFTANLVCEDVNNIHIVEKASELRAPQLDTTVGAYNQAPVFAQPENLVQTTSEVITEAPEFRELCISRRRVGVAVFYLQHPTDRTQYIQCDEFDRAFLRRCPAETVFTERLACEKISELSLVSVPAVPEPARFTAPVSTGYGETRVVEEPARFTAPVVVPQFDQTPVRTTGYGETRVVEEPARFTAPVVQSYAQRVEEPARLTAPVVVPQSSYGQRVEEPARFTAPVVQPLRHSHSGY
jgi:hypothetical protein